MCFFYQRCTQVQVVNAVVPKVQLCESENCPSVSRIGLGTLHLADKIGGVQTSIQVNEWVRNAVSNGINLFDCADVYPVKGGKTTYIS